MIIFTNKEAVVKIGLIVIVLTFYLLTCKYQTDDFVINDYSYFQDNCAKECKQGNDMMKCLDACAEGRTNTVTPKAFSKFTNNPLVPSYQPLIVLLIVAIVFTLVLVYKKAIFTIIDNTFYKLGMRSDFMKINSDDVSEDEYCESDYIKLTDI
jgi:hypothetical protein